MGKWMLPFVYIGRYMYKQHQLWLVCPIYCYYCGTHLANAFDIYTADTIIKLNEQKKKKKRSKMENVGICSGFIKCCLLSLLFFLF